MKATILTIFPSPQERERVESHRTARAEMPGSRPAEALAPVPATDTTGTPVIERILLQKLLAELDTRPVAPVQAPYSMEASPARRTRWFRVMWGALWVMSLAVCALVVKYIDGQSMIAKPDPAQARSVDILASSIADQNKRLVQMVDSVERLAAAVGTSSMHTRAVQAILKRLDSVEQPGPLPARELAAMVPKPPNAPLISSTPAEDPEEIPLGGHHHHPAEDIVALPSAVVHHNSKGVMDYWLLPRMSSGMKIMIKVVPVAQTSMGVLVHSVGEVRDYVVTPLGDWIIPSDSVEAK